MLQILIFNRKRVGETEKLLVSDFNKKHNIQKDSEIFSNLNATEKIVSERYMRMEVRGKLNRPVSLLISKRQIKLIELILSYRKQAEVSMCNEYVFGRGKSMHYDAAKSLREAAWECGAGQPQLLTGTRLRKHIATVSQAMDFTENEMAILADFMGHDIATHRKFYRLPSEAIHLAKISQLLISLEDGTLSQYYGKRLDDINININVAEDDEEDIAPGASAGHEPTRHEPAVETDELVSEDDSHNTADEYSVPSSSKKTTKVKVSKMDLNDRTPPKRKISIKRSWKTPERHAARKTFANHIKNEYLPTPMECLKAIRQNPALKGRTVQQLKAWVNNEIRRHSK